MRVARPFPLRGGFLRAVGTARGGVVGGGAAGLSTSGRVSHAIHRDRHLQATYILFDRSCGKSTHFRDADTWWLRPAPVIDS
ncbi:hypothetical protein Franean1_1689 [Parafrankia sp. EAN1pec]|nr:hypothetical protein Franean1_1689 [Frankia sp. EAN1pec]